MFNSRNISIFCTCGISTCTFKRIIFLHPESLAVNRACSNSANEAIPVEIIKGLPSGRCFFIMEDDYSQKLAIL